MTVVAASQSHSAIYDCDCVDVEFGKGERVLLWVAVDSQRADLVYCGFETLASPGQDLGRGVLVLF